MKVTTKKIPLHPTRNHRKKHRPSTVTSSEVFANDIWTEPQSNQWKTWAKTILKQHANTFTARSFDDLALQVAAQVILHSWNFLSNNNNTTAPNMCCIRSSTWIIYERKGKTNCNNKTEERKNPSTTSLASQHEQQKKSRAKTLQSLHFANAIIFIFLICFDCLLLSLFNTSRVREMYTS